MKPSGGALGKRSETQKGRGIERVNIKDSSKFNVLKWYRSEKPVVAASQAAAATNCA